MNTLLYIGTCTCVYLYRDRYKDWDNLKHFVLMFNLIKYPFSDLVFNAQNSLKYLGNEKVFTS